VTDHVKKHARDEKHAEELFEDQMEVVSKMAADAELARGGHAAGTTVTDPAGTQVTVKTEAKPWRAGLDKFLSATDEVYRGAPVYETNPDLLETKRRRAHNMERFVEPLIDSIFTKKAAQDAAFKTLLTDSVANQEKSLQSLAAQAMSAKGDSTLTTNILNQPTILAVLLVQMFQDMRFMQWVQPFFNGNGGEGFKFEGGNVVKIASEYFTDASGFGVNSGVYDAGNFFPEDRGIDEASIGLAWLTYGTKWRKGAISPSHELIHAMGGGPLNYATVARLLLHNSWRMGRAIDKGLADEMLNISDEYGAVAVAAEAYTTGNNKLPDLSVFNGGGSQVVNLNPTKLASAAVVAGTDPSVTYGATVLAAIRLKTRGAAHANPYSGTANGVDPIVRPRSVPSMANSGTLSFTTVNPFTVTLPANMVMGYLDANGDIQSIPDAAAATFAVDWENGVVVFNAAAGMAGAAGVMTTSTTVTYSYATNFDNFITTQAFATIPAGQSYEQYLSGLLTQISRTSAFMGSSGRFYKPDLALMTLNASVNIEAAALFYKLNSPDGTDLFPTEDYFATRNGVNMARHNTPWYSQDRRILLTRQGATRYGLETPMEVRGPYPKYDSSGRIKSNDVWYGEQNEVIATPQTVDVNGAVINPVSRTIVLR
jgi:hypothetical protein